MRPTTLFRIAVFAVAVLALGIFTATAQSGPPRPKQSAVAFLQRVITVLAANDYAQAWQSLHPAHQAVAAEEEYIACEELSPIPGRLESLVPIRALRKPVAIAGLPRTVGGVVVTFRLRLGDRALGASVSLALTAAAVPVGRRWAWMLPRARYELYRDDACAPPIS